jgi:hypothetical protein
MVYSWLAIDKNGAGFHWSYNMVGVESLHVLMELLVIRNPEVESSAPLDIEANYSNNYRLPVHSTAPT